MVCSRSNFLHIQTLFILNSLQFHSNNLVLIYSCRETLELSIHNQISITKRRQELKKKQSYTTNLFPRIIKNKLKTLNSRISTFNKNITNFAPITEFKWLQQVEIPHKDRNNKILNSNNRTSGKWSPFHQIELSIQLVTQNFLKLSRFQNLMSN